MSSVGMGEVDTTTSVAGSSAGPGEVGLVTGARGPARRAPGVHVEWLAPPPQVQLRRMDVAGFVGIAERGPLHLPVRVSSWTQFVAAFGTHQVNSFLAYAVEGFFANGGEACWVVRVADPAAARAASLDLSDDSGLPVLRLTATTPGVWGDEICVSVERAGGGRFWLGLQAGKRPAERWRDLSMDPADPRWVEAVVSDERSGSRLVAATSLLAPDRTGTAPSASQGNKFLEDGRDGLATLTAAHVSGEGSPPGQRWGLAALEAIGEVGVVVAPDIMSKPRRDPLPLPPPPPCGKDDESSARRRLPVLLEYPPRFDPSEVAVLQDALVSHCEQLRDRVAILDPPGIAAQPDQVIGWGSSFSSGFAALYYPWVLVADPLQSSGAVVTVPPSGHMAGVVARSDLTAGVHKPPANEVVVGARDVAFLVDDTAHAEMNDASVNVIRSIPGRDIRVMGARTLSSDSVWRYLNVRRLMLSIELSLTEGLEWVVFEPNNVDLWRDVDRVARQFLDGLWRQGMLDGSTAQEAYSVQCDRATSSDEDVARGRLVCLIAARPPWPAEFVLVRILVSESGVQVLGERGSGRG